VNANSKSRANRLRHRTRFASVISTAVAVVAAALLLAAPASATDLTPHWVMLSQPAPTEFHPGDTSDFYEVIAFNDGAAATTSAPITVTDTLPAGLTVNEIVAHAALPQGRGYRDRIFDGCESTSDGALVATATVTCTIPTPQHPSASIPAGGTIVVTIYVSVPVEGITGPLVNTATVSGGGSPEGSATSNSTALTEASQPVPFSAQQTADITDTSGALGTEAGSHPFSLTTLLGLSVGSTTPNEGSCNEGPSCALPNTEAKDVEVALPPGLVGNPTAVPSCSQRVFAEAGIYRCPPETQVGSVQLYFYGNGTAIQTAPVYNIEPPVGQPAEFGFTIAAIAHIPIFFHLRSDGDYGLSAVVSNINQFDPPRISLLTIWGFPSDPAHDPQRESDVSGNCGIGSSGCPSGVANPQPFLTLPTSCEGSSLPVSIGGDSWQNPLFPYPVFETASLAGMTGCNGLKFEPTLEARPTTNVADSPSGLKVDLKVPQNQEGPEGHEDPAGRATAALKEAKVTLPKGLTVNPSSAAGLEGCSPAQVGLRSPLGASPVRMSATAANCPDGSKLGSVEVDTQLIDHPLPGAVYLATPYENPFKSLLALYITVNDPQTNTIVKLAGEVQIAPDGQLTTTVKESPQVPFEDFKLSFFGGARGPLRTPPTCATYKTTSQLTPYSAPESGPPASPADSYVIGSAPGGQSCATTEAALPNKPGFEAGTTPPLAGAYAPFGLHLHREDASQNFAGLNLTLPEGLIGKLAGVSECSDAALATAASKSGAAERANPSCPASSQIGTVNAAAGAGPAPYNAPATAYLTGPYKGAPLGVAIITPAVAGPYDLGTVVVRSALYVDPETAQITVKSDPIPTALQGIQLDLRQLDLRIDRQQFTLNPTNCERAAITGSEISALGNVAALSDPFQVGGCGGLAFKPKLALSLKGDTKRTGHPALRATVSYPKGSYANIAKAQVTLPHAEFLDNAHIKTICTRVQFAAHQCPAASVYGHARAITPLLAQPLEGPVYLRSSSHKLPDLVADLNGQIEVDLAGRIDTGKGGGLRSSFALVPDAPVSKFTLTMQGGKKGLLINSENLCSPTAQTHASASFTGQNGKVDESSPVIANSCKAKAHHAKH
jgi:uncharacterized repeat protein (TIGR01451 family)